MTFFDGSNDLGTFAAGIVPFGAAMKSYGDAVADINTGAITASAVAAQSLARLQESLPLAGGVMEFFNGSHDLAAFAAGIIPFGAAMKSYSDAVADINPTAVETSASAGQALVELANTLPNTGGLLSFFTGGTDLTAFGDDLTSFGADLAAYAAAIKDVKPEAVTASANAASALSNLATDLPDSSLFDQWFGGDQTLASFGADISDQIRRQYEEDGRRRDFRIHRRLLQLRRHRKQRRGQYADLRPRFHHVEHPGGKLRHGDACGVDGRHRG